jgi:hypothetical protein
MREGVRNWNLVGDDVRSVVDIRFGDFGNQGWEVYDYRNCDSNVLGVWNGGSAFNGGYLRFNTCRMDASETTSSRRYRVAVHEIGHAIAFQHNDLNQCTSVMRPGLQLDARACYYPGSHDKSDYAEEWGRR